MKKGFLEVLQVLAFSAFVGISGYGILLYWGGETHEKLPVSSSLLLGLGAVSCIIVIVLTGGVLDKITADEDAGNQPETGIDG